MSKKESKKEAEQTTSTKVNINDFFLDRSKKVKYARKCLSCTQKCKQSFRAEIVKCPKFERAEKK